MLPYLVCFALTLAFAWVNEQLLKEEKVNKSLVCITGALVVLLPSVLAGCRDDVVGTDIYFYVAKIFDTAQKHGAEIITNPKLFGVGRIEQGFLALGYMAAVLFNKVQGFLFIIAFIINSLVYASLYKMREHCSIFLGEWVFLFTCYNESLNLMRQYIGMGLIMFALACVLKKQYFRAIPIVLCGVLFHQSSIVGLFIVLLAFCMEFDFCNIILKQKSNNHSLKLLVFACCLAVSSVYFSEFVIWLINKKILAARYLSYISGNQHANLSPTTFFYYSCSYLFFLLQIFGKKFANTYIAIALCDIAFYHLRSKVIWAYRISTYFFFLHILSLASMKLDLLKIICDRKISKDELCTIGMMITCVLYWWYFIIHLGHNETVPYISSIIGIF